MHGSDMCNHACHQVSQTWLETMLWTCTPSLESFSRYQDGRLPGALLSTIGERRFPTSACGLGTYHSQPVGVGAHHPHYLFRLPYLPFLLDII